TSIRNAAPSLTSAAYTLAPCSASRVAICAPRPLAAPVTSATFLSRRISTGLRALGRERHLGARKTHMRVLDVVARAEEADQFVERRGSIFVLRSALLQRLEQRLVVERGEQQVLVRDRCAEFLAQPRNPGLDVLARPLSHEIAGLDAGALEEFVRRLRGEPPVVAHRVLADLVRDRLVALALHHVQRRLRDDVLRERAHGDRVAEVAAYT